MTTSPDSRPLPMAENKVEDKAGAEAQADVREADIRALVDAFYGLVRDDRLLGPVFERHVADWDAHRPKMVDFWSSVVLRSGRYSGRPIDVHLLLSELTQAHFDRWLELWRLSVRGVIRPGAQQAFIIAAERMAGVMAARIVA